MTNQFIWADLSTFEIDSAKQFYKQCFDWEYKEVDGGYLSCQVHERATAGLYTMPEKLQSIGMPSFWMSYLLVEDIEKVVRVAVQCGAKVEVEPQAALGGGTIALIRDPAGAGFTCYEGEGYSARDKAGTPGCVVWNELHISDFAQVESFYRHVFGWQIDATQVLDRYEIFTSADRREPIAGIQVTRNEIKGDKEYWGVYFTVNSLSDTARCIAKSGGRIEAEQPLGTRKALLAYDSQGAAFYIVEV